LSHPTSAKAILESVSHHSTIYSFALDEVVSCGFSHFEANDVSHLCLASSSLYCLFHSAYTVFAVFTHAFTASTLGFNVLLYATVAIA